MKRPLMVLLGMVLLGLTAGQLGYLHMGYFLAAAAAAAGLIGRSISLLAVKKQVYGMLLLLLFLSGAAWGYLDRWERAGLQQEALAISGEVSVSGPVREVTKEGLIVDTELGRALVRVGDSSDEIIAGDGVRITGEIAELSESVNPGSFDAKSYYESEGVLFCFRTDEIIRREEDDAILTQLLAGIRRTSGEHIREILPEMEAGVLSAMLLGEKSGMDAELKSLYQKSGIAHILAISGLHISLLGGAL
ncbi:MAG: ComEC/Rec2 family competence protein, partial [Eubacterium sp.]|nr:ComEC/Rec2 family competence protein [Eubacterium sp.]